MAASQKNIHYFIYRLFFVLSNQEKERKNEPQFLFFFFLKNNNFTDPDKTRIHTYETARIYRVVVTTTTTIICLDNLWIMCFHAPGTKKFTTMIIIISFLFLLLYPPFQKMFFKIFNHKIGGIRFFL